MLNFQLGATSVNGTVSRVKMILPYRWHFEPQQTCNDLLSSCSGLLITAHSSFSQNNDRTCFLRCP